MYTIQNCIIGNVDLLNKGIYIVLEKPETIPPHIMLLIHGKFFSLSVKGAHLNEDSQHYFKLWNAKNRAILFVQLKERPLEAFDIATQSVKSSGTMGNGVTCLRPIVTFCSTYYSSNLLNHQFVFDLLKDLSESNLIIDCYTLNHESAEVSIPAYTVVDIQKAIEEARNSK